MHCRMKGLASAPSLRPKYVPVACHVPRTLSGGRCAVDCCLNGLGATGTGRTVRLWDFYCNSFDDDQARDGGSGGARLSPVAAACMAAAGGDRSSISCLSFHGSMLLLVSTMNECSLLDVNRGLQRLSSVRVGGASSMDTNRGARGDVVVIGTRSGSVIVQDLRVASTSSALNVCLNGNSGGVACVKYFGDHEYVASFGDGAVRAYDDRYFNDRRSVGSFNYNFDCYNRGAKARNEVGVATNDGSRVSKVAVRKNLVYTYSLGGVSAWDARDLSMPIRLYDLNIGGDGVFEVFSRLDEVGNDKMFSVSRRRSRLPTPWMLSSSSHRLELYYDLGTCRAVTPASPHLGKISDVKVLGNERIATTDRLGGLVVWDYTFDRDGEKQDSDSW